MKRRFVAKSIDALIANMEPGARCYDTELPALYIEATSDGEATYRVRAWNPRAKKMTDQLVGYTWEIGPTMARRCARQMIEAVKMGGDQPGPVVSVATLIERWMKHADENSTWKIQTWRNYDNIVRNHILPTLANVPVDSLGHDELQKLYDEALEGRSASTADAVLRCLQSALTWGERQGLVKPGFPSVKRMVDRESLKKRVAFLSKEEVARLHRQLDVCPNKEIADILRFLLLTGFRRGEAETLCWQDIDWARNAINLRDTKTGDSVRYVSNAVLQFLRQRPTYDEGTGLVFKVGRRTLTKWWGRIRKAARLPVGFRLHDIRHHFASTAVTSGLSMPIVAKLLGHSTTITTERYAHLIADGVAEAADSFAQELMSARRGTPDTPKARSSLTRDLSDFDLG